MSKTDGENELLEFIRERSDELTQGMLDLLNDQIDSRFPDLETDLIWALHINVLRNLLMIVNFPKNELASSDNTDECFDDFRNYAESQSSAFQDYCDALKRWRPGVVSMPSRKRKKSNVSSRRKAGADDSESDEIDSASITLSTGYAVPQEGDSTTERIAHYEHLVSAIVMEHFEGKLEDYKPEDSWSDTFEKIRAEIDYLLKNEIRDHSNFLREMLIIESSRTMMQILHDASEDK